MRTLLISTVPKTGSFALVLINMDGTLSSHLRKLDLAQR